MVRHLPRAVASAALSLIVLLAVSRGLAKPAAAYEFHGFRWPAGAISVSTDDPRLESYLTSGIAAWTDRTGLTVYGGDGIVVVVGELKPPVHYSGQPAQANVTAHDGLIERCEVRVSPTHFFVLAEVARRAVITHELGHCLGIDHSESPGIMKNPFLYSFTDDDRAAARALYPPPQFQPQMLTHRLFVPVVSTN